MAYARFCALRRISLAYTQFAVAACAAIRLKLRKLGALIEIRARRVKIAFPSACPWAEEWRLAAARLALARGFPPWPASAATRPKRRDRPRPTGDPVSQAPVGDARSGLENPRT